MEHNIPQIIHCQKCGGEIRSGVKFCANCGAPISFLSEESSISLKSPEICKETSNDDKTQELAESFVVKGINFMLDNKDDDAIICFNTAIEINPGAAGAWDLKGVILKGRGHHVDAITCFDTAIKLNPKDREHWLHKGIALHDGLNQYYDAISCFDKTIQIDPNYPSAWYYRGSALFEVDRSEDALINVNKSINLEPSELDCISLADAWFLRGVILIKLKRFKEVVPCFEEVIRLEPDNEELRSKINQLRGR